MTTITNFLHNNFLTMPQQKEVPLWCLTISKHIPYKDLRNYFLNHANHYDKCIIHLDLGISQLRLCASNREGRSQTETVLQLSPRVQLYRPYNNKNYFLMQSAISEKSKVDFLDHIFQQLNQFFTIPEIKAISGNKFDDKKFGLFVEGIQTVYLLNRQKQSRSLQSFLSKLGTLNQFAQITVLSIENQLPLQIQFALQRVSSCATKVQNNPEFNHWQCISTVRRQQTGFSNEENYTIRIIDGRVKVEKKVGEAYEEQTEAHKEIVKKLGFVPQKQKKWKEMSEEEREVHKMVYPHLYVQSSDKKACKCLEQACRQCNPQNDLGLIILDQEQEDDDDIDV